MSLYAKKQLNGFTLLEMMISMGIISIFLGVVMSIYLLAVRSYYVIRDQNDLMKQSRLMKEVLAQEIRNADIILNVSTNPPSLVLLKMNQENRNTNSMENLDSQEELKVEDEKETSAVATNVVYFILDDETHTFLRICQETNTTVLLRDCEEIDFRLYQRSCEPLNTNSLFLQKRELLPYTLNSAQGIKIFWVCRRYWDEARIQPGIEDSGEIFIDLRN